LYNTLARKLHRARTIGAAHDDILGLELIDKMINVDQDPIGNTPSSNPATYTGLFDLIRELFAKLPESKVRGYQPRRFSFNKPGGRCEACEGNGQKKIEMHFLPDVWVECDVCHGARYNPETLAVKYKGKSIADVLNMRVSEALEVFANIPKVRRVLQTLADVGLEYLALGQPAPTLSGGEAQRVKLAAELARPQTGRTLYLLDEPTTGLHFDDVRKLLDVLNRLVDGGNTVIVVEHNLDVIKSADWVIDLGPEAGEAGGRVVAAGNPEDVATVPESHTGAVLKAALAAGPRAERPSFNDVTTEAAGDAEALDVGDDARMPWEVDGPRWHTTDRITGAGKPPKWEGAILPWIETELRKLGQFGPTNWNHRTIIEIPALVKSQGWLLHAMTGQQWFLRLVFRVARNAFKVGELVRRLGIPSIAETVGIETSGGDAPRVQVANRRGPWQEVAILGFKLAELETPAFRQFLKDAAASFFANLKRMQTKPEDVMPWKINGERWHLGEKGFPPGKRIQWDRAILPRLLALLREIEPELTVTWDGRESITVRIPGATRAWAAVRTKVPAALEAKFLGRRGQFNLARLEPLGAAAELTPYKADGEVMRLAIKQFGPAQIDALRRVLREHLEGFRAAYGRSERSA
jgi:excinuclease ABC subunit A